MCFSFACDLFQARPHTVHSQFTFRGWRFWTKQRDEKLKSQASKFSIVFNEKGQSKLFYGELLQILRVTLGESSYAVGRALLYSSAGRFANLDLDSVDVTSPLKDTTWILLTSIHGPVIFAPMDKPGEQRWRLVLDAAKLSIDDFADQVAPASNDSDDESD